jgi:ATP phosphoribosyltransferase regulatory subunit
MSRKESFVTKMNKRYLQVPQGTEGVHLEEAYRHRQVTHRLFRLFSLWGYWPVETPVFDFYDIYRPLLGAEEKDVYRLIDRDGDLLMLRSDITLFLAKQMGLWLRDEDLPTRVCYSDTILRHQHAEDISKNEFFQTGAELIGKAGEHADLEILLLLRRIFEELELSPALHLGSHRFLTNALEECTEREAADAVAAIRGRDREALDEILQRRFPAARAKLLSELFSFIGEREEFEPLLTARSGELRRHEAEELIYLNRLARLLEEAGYGEQLRIDLSEVGAQPYYTGIVFQCYLSGLDSAVASGGRYDKLLSAFGRECPSVGFSLLQRKIEHLLDGGSFDPPGKSEQVESEDFITAFRKAEELRAAGKAVVL